MTDETAATIEEGRVRWESRRVKKKCEHFKAEL